MVYSHYFDSDVNGGWDCVRDQNEITNRNKYKFLCFTHKVISFQILIISILILICVSENGRAYCKKTAKYQNEQDVTVTVFMNLFKKETFVIDLWLILFLSFLYHSIFADIYNHTNYVLSVS